MELEYKSLIKPEVSYFIGNVKFKDLEVFLRLCKCDKEIDLEKVLLHIILKETKEKVKEIWNELEPYTMAEALQLSNHEQRMIAINYTEKTQKNTIMKKKYLEIINIDTDAVAKRIDVTGKNDRHIEKIEDGMNINLNHNVYYTNLNVSEGELPGITPK